MARIDVENLSVRFPVYGVEFRSLKKELARTVGGRMGKSATGHTVVQALEDVNFRLEAGDRLGLVGGNGSGKTTLLRVLAGAYVPDTGRVEITGKVSALLDVGMGLDASATGYENIYMRGLLNGLSRQEVDAKVDEIAAFSGLGDFLRMPLKAYSAGMQARLAFAAATAIEADILLMDEWIAVGDAEFRDAAQQRLVSLVDRASILVIASHDPSLINSLCNKILHLEGGRIVGWESPSQAVEHMLHPHG
ncbi:ABC transporter ATP-binding protein [Tabrizicola sp.]|uniref:ABC transporter ATP-binding protein n=1 Tax=Tabrizicola sp. TaxID=2005166 RepID=UPI00271CA535|nr:ABC transporter ATP-binding protein [Tabrizicola sp.]MDO8325278.1 ABC transporter ATP-binding protein [Phenylobacterium sp.]MDP3196653.1 ABC transporter ATP-binding protein [Tabrizicola sp.]